MQRLLSASRRWYHEYRGHKVVQGVTRDYRKEAGKYEFYFARSYQCVECKLVWLQHRGA